MVSSVWNHLRGIACLLCWNPTQCLQFLELVAVMGGRSTWRTHLIKVAAKILVSTRRIHVKLSGHWPFLDFYDSVNRIVTGHPSLSAPG